MIQHVRKAARRLLHANCTNLTHAEAARIFQEAWEMRNERDRLRIQMDRNHLAARRAYDKLAQTNRELQRAKEQHAQDETARQQAEQERAQQPTHTATSLTMFVVWALVVVAVVALGVAIWLTVGGK